MSNTEVTANLVDILPRARLNDVLAGLGWTSVEADSITANLHPESIYAALLEERSSFGPSEHRVHQGAIAAAHAVLA